VHGQDPVKGRGEDPVFRSRARAVMYGRDPVERVGEGPVVWITLSCMDEIL
jgi:hypothetical protein